MTILIGTMMLTGVVTWLARNAGEPTEGFPVPTFIGRLRASVEVRWPTVSRLLDCVFCTGSYVSAVVTVYVIAATPSTLDAAPLLWGAGVFGGVVVEMILGVASMGHQAGSVIERMVGEAVLYVDDAIEEEE